MDSLKVIGGAKLKGKIKISGAKNSALPLMACSLLLSKGELRLDSMPNCTPRVNFPDLEYSTDVNNRGHLFWMVLAWPWHGLGMI